MNVLMIVPPYLQSAEEAKENLPSTRMRSVKAVPMGALSIITYNKDKADFKLLDLNCDGVIWGLDKFQPDIVGISMTFDNSFSYIKLIVQTIRNWRRNTIIVIGGAATKPSQTYRIILEETDIDAVCFHDGELPFRDLITSKRPRYALLLNPSWITRQSLKAERVPVKSVVGNLNDIIELDYSYIDIKDYTMQEESLFVETKRNDKQFYVETSRGCPFQCAFCYYSRDNDRMIRYASVDKVVSYVKQLIVSHGLTVLSISDDQFMVNMRRAKEIFSRLIKFNIRVEILQGASVGFIDEEMADLMKRAGVVRVNLPIESGSQEVLDMMVEKPVNLIKAKEIIKILRRYGFWITANFVMGFPGETDAHRAETLQWVEEAGLDWCTFVAAIPIWGTKLYDVCVEKGYIKTDLKLGEMDFSNYFIHTPEYSPEYVTKEIYKMNLLCNFVNNYQMRHGDYITAARAFRKVIGMYPTQAFAHYYLAECLRKLGQDAAVETSTYNYEAIIKDDPKWMEYAQYFGLEEIKWKNILRRKRGMIY